MIEALQFQFMQNAVIAGILAAISCGVIGSFVVVNRISFISGGVAHASYGGVGLAIFFGLPVYITTIGFSVVAAIIMGFVSLKKRHRADAMIGILWAGGMSLGIIFSELTPGYQGELTGYLFGSILSVPKEEIYLMLILDGLVLGFIIFFFREFLSLSYDEEFAKSRGVPTDFFYIFLLVLISVSIVSVVKVVGMVLIIALLIIPPMIAEKYVSSLKAMIVTAVLLNLLFVFFGLWLSYQFNLASGAAVVLVATIGYGISFVVHSLLKLKKQKSII
ncbi:MAG: zinc transport system permease protein [bacterium]|jgi:zinc transport system permease protein